MNDQLSEAFDKAIPDQPPTTGWGAAARRRVARRRTAVAGVAGVAAVAIAVPLAMNLGGGQTLVAEPPPQEATEPPDANYPVESYEVSECREEGGTRVEITDLPDGKLPEGAERIWLCGGGEEGWVVNDTELVGARDPLTLGVDRAVEAFNALTFVPGATIDCLGDGATYHVVVEYPDGESHVVRGYNTPDGCDHFQLADGIVDGGGSDYLALLQELWAEQRQGRPVPDGSVHLCPAATSVWGIDPATATRAVACVPAEAGEPPRMQDAVPDALLQRILAGVAAVDEAEDPVADEGAPRLILSNEAGDPVTLRWQDVDGARSLVWGWGQKQYVSRPEASIAPELDALFEPAEAPATPGTEPPVNPAPVWEGELPECTGWVSGEHGDLDALLPAGRGCFVNDHGTLTVGDSLGPELAQEIIDAVRAEQVDLGFQPGLSGGPVIMLATSEGPPLRLALQPDGRVVFYHADAGGTAAWVPNRDLLERMWAVTYGSCRDLPPSATPSELVGLPPTHGVQCERDPAKGAIVELQPSNPPGTTPGPHRGPDMPIPVPTVEPKES